MEAFGVFPATDKKRKRSSLETADRLKNNSDEISAVAKEETSSPASAPTRTPPSEEEVEEFFSLLRRIHSAVKRTGKSSHGNVNGKARSKSFEGGSPSPLVDGGVSSSGLEVGADNGAIFDLNSVPDEAEEF